MQQLAEEFRKSKEITNEYQSAKVDVCYCQYQNYVAQL